MKPLWRCPKCGRRFVTRNVEHTCKLRPVGEHLKGKDRAVVTLYRDFLRLVRRHGPVEVVATKTAITLRTRVNFGFIRVLRDRLAVGLLLPDPVDHPRITKIQTAARRSHLHHFDLRSAADLDRDVSAWVRQAYRVGQQLQLKERGGWQWTDELPAAATTARRVPRLKPRPLWRCPKCGKYYVTRNIWHSCTRHTEAEHLRGKSEMVVWLYRRIVRMVRACGPLKVVPGKTGIAFQVRMRFGGVRLRKDGVNVGFILTRRLNHPRVTRVIAYTPRCHGHHVLVRSADDLDAELEAWLRESYRVGAQANLLAR